MLHHQQYNYEEIISWYSYHIPCNKMEITRMQVTSMSLCEIIPLAVGRLQVSIQKLVCELSSTYQEVIM